MTSLLKASIKTITPIRVPFSLKTGTNDTSPEYTELLKQIQKINQQLRIQLSSYDSGEFESIDEDVRSARIFTWEDSTGEWELNIHVFPNSVGIAEITFGNIAPENSDGLADYVRERSKKIIRDAYPRFLQLVDKLYENIRHPLLVQREDESERDAEKLKIFWITRALILTDAQRQEPQWHDVIHDWLSGTQHPQDAEEIIEGKRDYSMTWLHYIVVGSLDTKSDFRIDAMILAQYYYTAQEICNQQLKEAIAGAYTRGKLMKAQHKLEHSRITARLHLISFNEHLNYLSRPKRKLLDEILASWDFNRMVANSEKMIAVCSSRLQEADNRRRERSTVMTDLLLVTLSFFAVFELSLYLTEFSREVVSRPALDYNDENMSFFLSFIAGVDADIMFGLGFGLTLLLVIVYRFMKKR